MKNEKGITLIALVITIIVMLILVTVTIRVATDGNLFTHAANAAKGTKTAIEDENAILNDDLGIEAIVARETGMATPAATLIHFTIGGTPYDAEDGMTWAQWVGDSRYNTDGYKLSNSNSWIVTSDGTQAVGSPGRIAWTMAESADAILSDSEWDLKSI